MASPNKIWSATSASRQTQPLVPSLLRVRVFVCFSFWKARPFFRVFFLHCTLFSCTLFVLHCFIFAHFPGALTFLFLRIFPARQHFYFCALLFANPNCAVLCPSLCVFFNAVFCFSFCTFILYSTFLYFSSFLPEVVTGGAHVEEREVARMIYLNVPITRP